MLLNLTRMKGGTTDRVYYKGLGVGWGGGGVNFISSKALNFSLIWREYFFCIYCWGFCQSFREKNYGDFFFSRKKSGTINFLRIIAEC